MGRWITLYCPGCQRIERRDETDPGDPPGECPACGTRRERLDAPPPAKRPLWPLWISIAVTIAASLVIVACGAVRFLMFTNQLSGGGFYPPLWVNAENLGVTASIALTAIIAVWVIPLFFRPRSGDP